MQYEFTYRSENAEEDAKKNADILMSVLERGVGLVKDFMKFYKEYDNDFETKTVDVPVKVAEAEAETDDFKEVETAEVKAPETKERKKAQIGF